MVNIQVSKNFTLDEFKCKCGKNHVVLDADLVEKLQKLRERLGKAVTILSGYRCPEHNAAIGGEDNSYHMKGMAADIKVIGYSPQRIAEIAEQIGFDGIHAYVEQKFVHVDVRGYRARW